MRSRIIFLLAKLPKYWPPNPPLAIASKALFVPRATLPGNPAHLSRPSSPERCRCLSPSGAQVLARFTEVESGGRNDRPELGKALTHTRLTGATLVVAKLDRLSRNAAFLLTLQASGVRFVACDFPQANHLTVGIMALVAQAEREAISSRTKEALAAAKVRGGIPKVYHLKDQLP